MKYDSAVQSALRSVILTGSLLGILAGCGGGGGSGNDPASQPENNNTGNTPQTVTLSGTVIGGANVFVDSDVNDPDASYAANDMPGQAQAIPNPVMLGGYLNEAHTGPAGPLFATGDRSDFFRVSLAANQNVTVNIADFDTGDFDLYIYYDDGSIDLLNPDFISEGVGQTETLTIPQDGDYLIEVYAFSGYSNYALVIGQGAASLSTNRLVSTDDFVPGEVIVRFNDARLPLSVARTPATLAATIGLQFKAGDAGRAMLMEISPSSGPGIQGATANQMASQERRFRSPDPERQQKLDTLRTIKLLRKRNDIRYAEPNFIRQPLQIPTDSYYGLQWHYPLIKLPTAWDVTTGSPNVIVAVIDTGVLLNHPDLQGQFSSDGGFDFIRDDNIAQDNEPGIDINADDPGDSRIGSSSFHGTHVAGTIAATTSFGAGGSGVAGIAPGVKIMPLRVLGNGGGTGYDILQAVRYAAGLSNDSGIIPPQKADVINLSLGGPGGSQAEQDAYTQARGAGVIIVAAAGNSNVSDPFYPAAYNGIISVSALDMNKQRAPYSNFGTTIDVAAPGGDTSRDLNGDGYPDGVLSTVGDDSGGNIDYVFKFLQGTSMASPHMAGVLALMKSVHGNLTPDDVDTLLASGQIVEDLGAAGRDDQFGHGMIDARKAVDAATALAQGSNPDNPVVSVSPASLNFGNSATNTSLSIINGGTGALSIASITTSASWLTVIPGNVDAITQLGDYQVSVDRSGLAAGIYTADITIVSTSNTVSIPVIQRVGGQGSNINAGYQYILLVDADSGDIVDQWEGSPQNGEYNFVFDNVSLANGKSYFIFAGTDQNNDGFICDAGETCGAYVSLVQPIAISDGGNNSGLDFISGFNTGLQNLSASGADNKKRAIRRKQTKKIP